MSISIEHGLSKQKFHYTTAAEDTREMIVWQITGK